MRAAAISVKSILRTVEVSTLWIRAKARRYHDLSLEVFEMGAFREMFCRLHNSRSAVSGNDALRGERPPQAAPLSTAGSFKCRSGFPQSVGWIDLERASRGPDARKQTRGKHHSGRGGKIAGEERHVFRSAPRGSQPKCDGP